MTYLKTATHIGLAILSMTTVAAVDINKTLLAAEQINPQISKDALQLAQEVYQAMEPYLLDSDIDACAMGLGCTVEGISIENKRKLIRRLASLIENKQPVELNLVAFPFKSGNRDHNVLGHLADMAEFKSLEYLDTLRTKMAEIYPDCKLTIYTDGLLFNDLFEIPDEHVTGYEQSLRQLAAKFPEIKIITLTDMLDQSGLNLQNIRANSDSKTQETKLPSDKALLMRKRIEREINHSGHSFAKLNREKQKAYLDHISTLVLGRVQTARAIVKQFERPGSFSLSAHYQRDFDIKLGIKLFPNTIVTPPNAVFVEQADGSFTLQYKKDVDTTKYKLVSVSINNVSCPYFSWR
jgi:pyoverdine/dityrosine biosynthesis protein Dit1